MLSYFEKKCEKKTMQFVLFFREKVVYLQRFF